MTNHLTNQVTNSTICHLIQVTNHLTWSIIMSAQLISLSFHISHKTSVVWASFVSLVWASFVSFHMGKLKHGKRREKNKAVKNPQKRVFTISLVSFFIYRTSSLPFPRLISYFIYKNAKMRRNTKRRRWKEIQRFFFAFHRTSASINVSTWIISLFCKRAI